METGRLWVKSQVKSREKFVFTSYVFFHIWVYLIIYNYYMYWILVAYPTICHHRLLQPVCSWVWSITLSYWTTFFEYGPSLNMFLHNSWKRVASFHLLEDDIQILMLLACDLRPDRYLKLSKHDLSLSIQSFCPILMVCVLDNVTLSII